MYSENTTMAADLPEVRYTKNPFYRFGAFCVVITDTVLFICGDTIAPCTLC